MSSRLKANVAALAAGILVAVVSVAAYHWLGAILQEQAGAFLVVSALPQARIAAAFALLMALPIMAISIPLWALLTRFRMNSGIAAAALGFLGALAAWVVLNDSTQTVAEALSTGLPYGVCGALAGIMTWWASPARRRIAPNE